MTRSFKISGTTLMVCGLIASANAAIISFEKLAGPAAGAGIYTYSYTLQNDSGMLINDFLISFPNASYTSLYDEKAPIGWALSVFPPGDLYPGLFEGSGSLAPGASISGFRISFNYIGDGIPSDQTLEIYDVIGDQYSLRTMPVPESSTWFSGVFAALFLVGRSVRAKIQG